MFCGCSYTIIKQNMNRFLDNADERFTDPNPVKHTLKELLEPLNVNCL